MKKWTFLLFLPLAFVTSPSAQYELNTPMVERPLSEAHAKSRPLSMAELSQLQNKGVLAVEVSDYVYGNYRGDFQSPPHADLNPRKAFIIQWKQFPYRFVFSGYRHDYTRIKEHTFNDTGYTAWGSSSWDHWPIGWINSQGHVVDENSFHQYPNCFATVGMDFFALPDKESARGVYYSLLGVGAGDGENIRQTVRAWLEKGGKGAASPDCCAQLPSTDH